MIKFTDGIETNVGEKANNAFMKLVTSKAIYVLMTLAAFVVLSGANEKFTG